MHLSLLLPWIYLCRKQFVPCWTHGVRSSSMWWRVQWLKWPLIVGVWQFTLLRQEEQYFQQCTRPQQLSCPDTMILELISCCNDMHSHIKSTVAAVLAVNVKVQSCNQNTFSHSGCSWSLWRPGSRFTIFIYQRILVTDCQCHTGSSNLYSTYLFSWILLKICIM